MISLCSSCFYVTYNSFSSAQWYSTSLVHPFPTPLRIRTTTSSGNPHDVFYSHINIALHKMFRKSMEWFATRQRFSLPVRGLDVSMGQQVLEKSNVLVFSPEDLFPPLLPCCKCNNHWHFWFSVKSGWSEHKWSRKFLECVITFSSKW